MMNIYFFMLEAVPSESNPESKELGGAFVNCWVKAETMEDAFDEAVKDLGFQGWKFVRIEDEYITERERYLDNPESLECYDEACEYGMSGVFYTYPIEDESEN